MDGTAESESWRGWIGEGRVWMEGNLSLEAGTASFLVIVLPFPPFP